MQELIHNRLYKVHIDNKQQIEFDQVCKAHDYITFDWWCFATNNKSYLHHVLCNSSKDCIQLNVFIQLFPNVKRLVIQNAPWEKLMVKEILDNLKRLPMKEIEMID